MNGSFWWVNHSQTFRAEIEGSYLWFADIPRKSKARSESEKNIQRMAPADVVFSCADGSIGAVGVVLGSAREASQPVDSDLESGATREKENPGWLVPVRFMPLAVPLRLSDHMSSLAHVLPRKHSPILSSGAGNQHMALAAVPPAMATALGHLLSGELERIVGALTEAAGRSLAEDAAEAVIQHRADIGPARKWELLKARNGQGSYRTHLEEHENSCRLTRVLDRRHLLAVHMKPWSDCDDAEKLDGANGLLMSPHVAHLFERGYISFSDEGELLVSQELNPVVLANWHIDLPVNVGEFRPDQCYYLDFHRREVFQQHGAGRRQKTSENVDLEPIASVADPATVEPA